VALRRGEFDQKPSVTGGSRAARARHLDVAVDHDNPCALSLRLQYFT
jgi:hypothetical protein